MYGEPHYADNFPTANYVLPCEDKVNPANPKDSDGYAAGIVHDDSILITLRRLDKPRTRPTRVICGSGGQSPANPYEGWQIGACWSIRHDQTDRFLGDYEVAGWHNLGTGERMGDVPDRLMALAVFK